MLGSWFTGLFVYWFIRLLVIISANTTHKKAPDFSDA